MQVTLNNELELKDSLNKKVSTLELSLNNCQKEILSLISKSNEYEQKTNALYKVCFFYLIVLV